MCLAFDMQTIIMNKKIIGAAFLLGLGVAYCMHLMMGNNKPAKMNAPVKH
jgi:hypothetical protein